MTVRLLATDLDGTLLLPDATVSPRVTSALTAAHDAGIIVVILTARSWRSLVYLPIDDLPGNLAVCSNGAVVYDLEARNILRSHHLDGASARAFLERASATCDLVYAWETATRAFRTPAYDALRPLPADIDPEYAAAIEIAEAVADDHEVTKVLIGHATMTPDELFAALTPHAESVTLTLSGGWFVEAMAPGITKAFTLASVCDDLGITADEVVAVGDHGNDLPMLRWAGRGVAMGNAHPSVLAEITEHTAPNTEDGLALVIESLLT